MFETEIPPEESEESPTDDHDDQDDQDDDTDEIAVAPADALAATSILTPAPPAPAPPPTTEALARQRILQWAAAKNWPAYAGAGVKIEQGKRDWQIYSSFFSGKQLLTLAAALVEGEEPMAR